MISKPMAFLVHGKIQANTAAILLNFIKPRSLGLLVTECDFRLAVDTVRSPDVAFIRAERVARLILEQRVEGAPDLAIAIISPSETAAQIARKVRQYLHAGAQALGAVSVGPDGPRIRAVDRVWILEAGDLLESPELLPDFSVRVSELFD